ncbi:MAG: ABC transporter permease [Bacteroidetes bacterium]|nr:MAG: ABC transporter permease [Bacteroidota bacterium]
MRLTLQIAFTQMMARKKQTAVATLGVTFGIGMFILMVSFMTGINILLEETMLSATPHIRIYHEVKASKTSIIDEVQTGAQFMNVVHHIKPKDEKLNVKNGLMIAENLRQEPEVLGVSPQLTSQVFYNFGPIQLNGSLMGVQILEENKLFDLRSKLVAGRIEDVLASHNGLLMGVGLAKKLNMKVGDKVTISTPKGTLKLMQVVGIFKYGIGAIDDVRSYTNLPTVQKILGKDSRYVTDISLKLKDYYQAKRIAQIYEKKYEYKCEDWETANATILVSFTLRNIITYTVSITLLVVAGFGIYNIMNMTIYEKMKDIAILKAMGFAGGDVREIFLIQALTIGFMGAATGLMLGFILSVWVGTIPFDSGGFLAMNTFPINYDIRYYIIGFVFSILTTFLAGLFPSIRASKIDPIQILRG